MARGRTLSNAAKAARRRTAQTAARSAAVRTKGAAKAARVGPIDDLIFGRTSAAAGRSVGRSAASMPAARAARSDIHYVVGAQDSANRTFRGVRRTPNISRRAVTPPGRDRRSLAQHGKAAAAWVRSNPGKTAAGIGVGVAGMGAYRNSGRATDRTSYTTGMYGY